MIDWQPISTAPNDGTDVLVSDGEIVWISRRQTAVKPKARIGEPPLGYDWYQPTIYNRPVEWQPLPKPTRARAVLTPKET